MMMSIWRERMIQFEILNKIEETGSTNEKKIIFKEFCKRKENIQFIHLAFNNVEYNVAKKTIEDALSRIEKTDNDWFKQTLNDEQVIDEVNGLTKFSGGDLKRKLTGMFSNMEEQQIKWFRRAILHNLEMGFDVKLINKVLAELGEEEVYYFQQPQLCSTIKVLGGIIQYPKNIPKEVFIEEKFDGVRALIRKKGDVVEIISRNGKKYRNFPKVVEAAKKIKYDFVFDCEIVAEGEDRAMDNYQKLTTILQRKDLDGVKEVPIKCMIFDVIELNNVEIIDKTQFERRGILDSLENVELPFERTKIIWLKKNSVWNQVQEFYDEIVAKDGEGIIIKNIHAPYKFESRDKWWKVKPIKEDTFMVVDYGYGEGKTNSDRVAWLEVQVGDVTNRVGSGISDEMSAYMTTNKDKLIGKKVDLEFTEITKANKLRFPRFIRFRDE